MTRRVAVSLGGLLAAAVLTGGCGVEADPSPLPIPVDDFPDLTSSPSPSPAG